ATPPTARPVAAARSPPCEQAKSLATRHPFPRYLVDRRYGLRQFKYNRRDANSHRDYWRKRWIGGCSLLFQDDRDQVGQRLVSGKARYDPRATHRNHGASTR